MKTLQKIADVIDKNKTFLVLTHVFIDGDALGSQLAMAGLLRKKGKDVYLIGDRQGLDFYSFLPGSEQVKENLSTDVEIDVAIVVDCGSKERLGEAKKYLKIAKTSINIDHHLKNTKFADVNWVRADASSAGEMVYQLFKELKEEPDKDDALCIYTAILTDTGSFRYASTTPRTHEIAAALLRKGIRPEYVSESLYNSHTYDDIALLREVLSGMTISPDGRIAWLRLSRKTLQKINYSQEMVDSFISYPRSIKTVHIAILFKEINNNKVKISFRSNYGVNVAKLAALWGGGGHHRASGCTITGSLAEIERGVIARTQQYL